MKVPKSPFKTFAFKAGIRTHIHRVGPNCEVCIPGYPAKCSRKKCEGHIHANRKSEDAKHEFTVLQCDACQDRYEE